MSEAPDMLRVEIDGGKYTLVQDATGKQFALRNGEPWRDLVGDKLTLCMGYEIAELREQKAALIEACKTARTAIQKVAGNSDETRFGWALRDIDAALLKAGTQ